jgi:hypothetical protein
MRGGWPPLRRRRHSQARDIAHDVHDNENRRHAHGNDSPPTQKQVDERHFPKAFVNAGFAELTPQGPGKPQEDCADILAKLDMFRGRFDSTHLAVHKLVSVIRWVSLGLGLRVIRSIQVAGWTDGNLAGSEPIETEPDCQAARQ